MEKHEKYEQVWDGAWSDFRWRGNQHRCCDCGAIHHLDARVRKGGLQLKWTADKPLTYATRRRMGIKIVKTK